MVYFFLWWKEQVYLNLRDRLVSLSIERKWRWISGCWTGEISLSRSLPNNKNDNKFNSNIFLFRTLTIHCHNISIWFASNRNNFSVSLWEHLTQSSLWNSLSFKFTIFASLHTSTTHITHQIITYSLLIYVKTMFYQFTFIFFFELFRFKTCCAYQIHAFHLLLLLLATTQHTGC